MYALKRRAQTVIGIFALTTGVAASVNMLVLWWIAKGNGWVAWAQFNQVNEHWVEGVLFHLAVVALALHGWWFLKERAKK